jgi:hypothetical protein
VDKNKERFSPLKRVLGAYNMNEEDPIQNLDSIDIYAERKTGGVDLVIMASSYLDDSDYHEQLLRKKVQVYIDAIFSDNWIEKYGKDNCTIFIKAKVMPSQNILNLIGGLKKHLNEFNVELYLELYET